MKPAGHRPTGTGPRASAARRSQQGVTLIELMIVVAIIAIIAAIAFPAYQNQVQQARRADGQGALLQASQQLERCFTRFNSYTAAGCAAQAALADADGIVSPEGFYRVRGTTLTPTTYVLTATPLPPQDRDTRCTSLTVNQAGERGATGSAVDRCW